MNQYFQLLSIKEVPKEDGCYVAYSSIKNFWTKEFVKDGKWLHPDKHVTHFLSPDQQSDAVEFLEWCYGQGYVTYSDPMPFHDSPELYTLFQQSTKSPE